MAKTCYCQQCSTRAICHDCGGPLWIDATAIPRCRWCNLQNLDFTCAGCGSKSLRQGLGGATRSVAEFGKSFPGTKVVESSFDKPVLKIKPGKALVVSTPGAEPLIDGGYAAVVILDAGASLHLDSLRAAERAVIRWANAISLLSPSGRAVIAGVPQALGQKLALWQVGQIATDALAERREHAFPPHLRMASVQGELEVARKVIAHLQSHMPQVQVLGPIAMKNGPKLDNRFVLKFNYSDGLKLAEELRAAILMEATGPQTSAAGRNSRAIKVRMDDAEVI
jgi:primosomal protein N' (replication factor Y)